MGYGSRKICPIVQPQNALVTPASRPSGKPSKRNSTSSRRRGVRGVFREKVSGAKVDRKELGKLLKSLAAGDQVIVTRIDRLARSVFELFAIVKKIIDAGGQFLSLAEPWADTSTSTGRLMIAVLGGLADVERDLIRTRTGEGRARAKLRGQHMGRPPKMTAAQKQEARRRRKDGESVADLARSYGVSPAAIYRTTA